MTEPHPGRTVIEPLSEPKAMSNPSYRPEGVRCIYEALSGHVILARPCDESNAVILLNSTLTAMDAAVAEMRQEILDRAGSEEKTNAMLQAEILAHDALKKDLAAKDAEIERLKEEGCAKLALEAAETIDRQQQRIRELTANGAKNDDEIQQILGRALDYPWYKDDQKNFPGATEADGVCVGEHVAVTLAEEAAKRIRELEEERDKKIAAYKIAGTEQRIRAAALEEAADLVQSACEDGVDDCDICELAERIRALKEE